MKKILISFLFIATAFVTKAQDAKPSKEETYAYIQKLLDEVDGYTVSYTTGATDKITFSTFSSNYYMQEIKKGNYMYYGNPSNKDIGCTDNNYYSNIDFSKLNNEPTSYNEANITITSSLKKLKLSFTSNSVLYEKGGDCADKHPQQPVSQVIFVYRNEDGVKERLIKAIMHLSKLRKEEEKGKSDPFGN
ncbi:MAG: hypothetical protein H7320_03165 [Ferruginibacter sp.]|nr:hypothetical protein [Ferruginibacter sp.]